MLILWLQYAAKESGAPGLSLGRKDAKSKEDAVAEINKVSVPVYPEFNFALTVAHRL
jgi:hypothetical protein